MKLGVDPRELLDVDVVCFSQPGLTHLVFGLRQDPLLRSSMVDTLTRRKSRDRETRTILSPPKVLETLLKPQ